MVPESETLGGSDYSTPSGSSGSLVPYLPSQVLPKDLLFLYLPFLSKGVSSFPDLVWVVPSTMSFLFKWEIYGTETPSTLVVTVSVTPTFVVVTGWGITVV